MKIDVYCHSGSPIDVTWQDLYGLRHRVGIGGAEYALLVMCNEWGKRGHDVTLYNLDHAKPSTDVHFCQCNRHQFSCAGNRDVLITFRNPNPLTKNANGYKVWWSCDQLTEGNYAEFSKYMDKVVCISPYHQRYFERTYKIIDTVSIDLPVILDDYKQEIEKVPYRMIWASVPSRGLHILCGVWDRIKERLPEASLTITSDWRLWGIDYAGNDKDRLMWLGKKDVKFLSAVPRKQLAIEQMQAEMLPYSCSYEELFCIACAEAEVAGAYPITSSIGALESTNMGKIIDGNANTDTWQQTFVDEICIKFEDRDKLTKVTKGIQKKALFRFNPSTIVDAWDEFVFNEIDKTKLVGKSDEVIISDL